MNQSSPNQDVLGSQINRRQVRKFWLDGWLRKRVLSNMGGLQDCQLIVREGTETTRLGEPDHDLAATITIDDPAAWRMLALGGSVGAGEAYMLDLWHADDLPAVIRIFVRNRDLLDTMETGTARLAAPALALAHRINRNTVAGSKRNIEAHYDLGNEFFALFLDETLTYSCGIFDSPQSSLAHAQRRKMDRICRKLALQPHHHLLEIGTGWGALAIFAAQNYGCKVTTTTISDEQFQLASQRVRDAGLEDRITLLKQDYRELQGRFDRLVSVEMIEGIGHQYMDTYFRQCGQLLLDDGAMLLQAITIEDSRYEQARDSVDFIKRYVFPGCFIPSVTAMLHSLTKTTDLKLFHCEDIGPHYATTLARWRERFLQNKDAVREQGFPEHFLKLWEYYLAYCQGGFAERALGDVQMLLTKPRYRGQPLLPSL